MNVINVHGEKVKYYGIGCLMIFNTCNTQKFRLEET